MAMTMERTPRVAGPPSRAPRLIAQSHYASGGRVVVVCNSIRKNGRTCNAMLGELNLVLPHDVLYRCQHCGATYLLQKDIA